MNNVWPLHRFLVLNVVGVIGLLYVYMCYSQFNAGIL